MEMTIKVEIGVTPALESLARSFLGRQGVKAEEQQQAVVLDTRALAKNSTKAAEKATKAEAKPDAQKEAVAEAKEAVVEATGNEPKSETKSSYTEEDIRQAMHECRCRIEGADYKENTESEGYKKYHKALTARFKEIAQLSGYEKPSALPAEHRAGFIRRCEDIIIDDGGKLTDKLSF